MNILITGATGFLGLAMVRTALVRKHNVRCMIRSSNYRHRIPVDDENVIYASMTDHALFEKACLDIDTVINCAAVTSSAGRPNWKKSRAVNIEGSEKLFKAAGKCGVKRWVQISSMSAHPESTSAYGRTKLEIDEFLRASNSNVAWTILRPSLIYGPDERGLVSKTLKYLKNIPILPIIGSGEELIRPVYVEDVSILTLNCIENPISTRKTYMAGGATEVTLNHFMGELCRTFKLKRIPVHLPLWLAMMIAHCSSLIMGNPPITTDNVRGVRECPLVDHQSAVQDLGYEPMELTEGLDKTRHCMITSPTQGNSAQGRK